MENENQTTSTVKKTPSNRIWTGIEILNVRLRFIFLMVLVGLIAGHWDSIMNHYDRWTRPKEITLAGGVSESEFYCPMHPNIIRGQPGSCPICGMPLAKREKTQHAHLPEGVLAQVQLTPLKMEMGRIGTSPVAFRLLAREIRTVGILDYDETRMAFISSRVKGRIDKLMVNYVGQRINKGDPLTSIYSPDLIVAQEELLATLRALQKPGSETIRSETEFLKQAAIKKLLLLGITQSQIDEIIRRGIPETHLIIFSPIAGIVTEKNVRVGQYVEEGTQIFTIADLGIVWMQAKIFEDQITGIKIGTSVQITASALPNEVFAGRITFIAYTVDPATRTVSARVEIDNPNYKLKPGMYATAAIRLPVGSVTELKEISPPQNADHFVTGYFCPIYPDQVFPRSELCPIDKFPFKFVRMKKVLAVPESAVIDTGTRKAVYRESSAGTFDLVEIKVGRRAGEYYPVLSGLKPGDRVATRGAFLVDAENRLNPAAAVQYFGATGGPKTEHH
jgi:membrane fusion protein, copper/silver efflux system